MDRWTSPPVDCWSPGLRYFLTHEPIDQHLRGAIDLVTPRAPIPSTYGKHPGKHWETL